MQIWNISQNLWRTVGFYSPDKEAKNITLLIFHVLNLKKTQIACKPKMNPFSDNCCSALLQTHTHTHTVGCIGVMSVVQLWQFGLFRRSLQSGPGLFPIATLAEVKGRVPHIHHQPQCCPRRLLHSSSHAGHSERPHMRVIAPMNLNLTDSRSCGGTAS